MPRIRIYNNKEQPIWLLGIIRHWSSKSGFKITGAPDKAKQFRSRQEAESVVEELQNRTYFERAKRQGMGYRFEIVD